MTYTVTGSGGCANATATRTVTITPNNTIALSSAAGSNAQTLTIGTAITNITYSTTGATGASFSGLPAGVTGTWASNTATISGTPSATGTFNYTATLTGGCTGGANTASGSIVVNSGGAGNFNIVATIDSVNSSTCAVGDTLVIPITMLMASGISTSAISLAIDYDSTKLQCISAVTGLNAAISSGFLSNCGLFSNLTANAPFNATTRRQFRAAWFALTPVTVNGLMFNLRFRVLATGNSSIKWDIATPGNAEFADEFADVIPNVSWVNGTITCGAAVPPCGITLSSAPSTTNQTICQNSNIANILYATTAATGATVTGLPAGVTGAWANNTVTISGTPTATGTFNYTVTLSGCTGGTGTTSGTLTVTTPLSAGTLSGNQSICVSGTTSFSSSVTGGSWNSSDPAVATINASTGLVTGVAAGTAVMTYTVSGTGGCANATATRSLTVSAAPTAGTLSGTQTVCLSETTTFTSTISGGTWTSSATGVATINASTGLVTGVTAGSATMTYTVSGTGGCANATATRSVIVLPNSTITLRDSICPGSAYVFGQDTLRAPGFYLDTLMSFNGCDSIIELNLFLHAVPQAPILSSVDSTICPGDTATLQVTPSSAFLTYRWLNNGVPVQGPYGSGIIGTSGSRYLTNESGNYSVVVINPQGCQSIPSATYSVNFLSNLPPQITQQPVNVTANIGDTAVIGIQANNFASIQWQYQPAGSSVWLNALSNSGISFVGGNTTTLKLVASSPSYNGLAFRAITSGVSRCASNLTSATSILTVNQLISTTLKIDSIQRCQTNSSDTILVNVTANQFNQVGLAMLQILKSPGLSFIGIESRNPLLFTLSTQTQGDTIIVSGFGGGSTGVSLSANSILFKLKLVINPGQQGLLGLSWVPQQTYLSDPLQGQWQTSLINGGLNILPSPSTQLNQSICQGQSYSFGSQTLTSAGIYTRTLRAANDCDSLVTLNLNVNSISVTNLIRAICSNQSFNFGGQALSVTGNYSDTLPNILGCDSIINLQLLVDSIISVNSSQRICPGDSFLFGSSNLTLPGIYQNSYTSFSGCDSVVTLNLQFYNIDTSVISESICQGQSFAFGTQNLTTAGTYNRTVTAANGCDSVITLNLSVRPNATAFISQSICQGQSFSFGSQSLTTAGTFNRTIAAANGCDSVITLNLSVRPNATASFSESICQGQSFSFGSQSLTTAGTYNRTVTAANGCDSVITLNLSVRPNATASISQSICQGQSFSFGSQSLTTAGTYNRTVTAANGCDSVITLNLSVRPNATATISQSICQGQSFSFGSQSLTTAGTYNRTITAANGCDSVITLNLSVRPNATATISQSICQGQSFSFGSQSLTTAGTYTRTITAANGCDSVITLNLTVSIPPDAGSISGVQNICVNATTSFSSTATGGSWSSSTPAVATVNATTGLVTGLTAGTATITYTVVGTGGCANATATRTVTVTAAPTAGTLSGSQGICVSGTSTFTSTVTGGAWSSSTPAIATVNATTGLVTGIAAGTATMTYTVTGTGGCANATATRTVTVTTAPTAGTLSGNQSICVTGTTTFTSTISGGAWSSSTPAVATVNATTGLVTGLTAGTATITYTVVGTGGCANATATRTVTVTAAPTAGTLSGSQGICVSGTSTFTSTVTGGAWSSSTPAVATVNATTGLVTGLTAGTATMTYTVTGTGGCTNATATRTVTVTAAPTAGTLSGNQSICVSGTSTFTSTISGGAWSSSTPAVATVNATSGLVTGVTAGTATITYTVTGTGGCSNATETRTVTVTAITAGTLSGTQNICVNGTSTFTSTVSGGSWSSSSASIATVNATSGVVTGVAAGTATITYTVTGTGGCTNATATRTVTVTAAPTAGTLSGNQSICVSGTSTFTSTISGGAWSSSTPAVATVNATSGLVTGVTAGTATITYTVTGTGGCSDATATRTVTVTATTAGTLSGTQNICVNGTSSFTSTVSGGSWSSSSTSIATVNATSGVVTGVAAGTATITYTVIGTGGCANATATRTVTVTAAPNAGTLSGNQNICSNGTTTFASTATGGTWSSSAPGIATVNATSGLVTGVSGGTATITYTVAGSGGCADATATRSITVRAVANTNLTDTICQGSTYTFRNRTLSQAGVYRDTLASFNACDSIITLNLTVLAKPSRPTIRVSATGDTLFATPSSNINWYRNGQPLLGGTNGILLINQNGIYFALRDVTFGLRTCYSDTSNILNVTNVGIDLPNSPNISAYPIPTSSTLNIRGILEQEPVEMHMSDISGREVTSQWHLADRSDSTITLDVSDLAGGIYQLKIKALNSSETYFVRFIKSH
jgi:uncharacterized protein YjdB